MLAGWGVMRLVGVDTSITWHERERHCFRVYEEMPTSMIRVALDWQTT